MELTKILEQTGLNERETKVYLALLELGESTVQPISKKSGIERTYCYDILSSLAHKGLATSHVRNGRQRFIAQPPETLEGQLAAKLNDLRQAMPELKAKYNADTQKPIIRFYEGKEAVNTLYQELSTAKEVDTIASITELEKHLGETLEEMAKNLVSKKAEVRELLTSETRLPKFTKYYKKPLQEVRYLPEKINLATDTIIYDNKVVFISYVPDFHAVVIEGSEIVSTQKKLFDIIWQSGKKA